MTTHNKGAKLAMPRTQAEIQDVEDRLSQLAAIFREIRLGLKDGPMKEVVLKLGTFTHYLDLAEPLAKKYRREYADQLDVHAAKQTRERKRGAEQPANKTTRKTT